MVSPRVLEFPRPDPLRELQAHLDERFDRLEAILCGEARGPPGDAAEGERPGEASASPGYAPGRVLPYEPCR